MFCDLLSRELRYVCRRVFGFLLYYFSSAMGCFFICLRFRDGDSDRSYRLDKKYARFLKACRTLPETPVEIRKAGKRLQRSPRSETHSITPKFHSWMPNTSPRKLWTDKQPSKLLEGFEIDAESPDHTPISCISNVDNSESSCISSTEVAASGKLILAAKVVDDKNISIAIPFTPWPAGRNTQGGSKSVHFHRDINICSPDDSLPGNACSGFKIKDSKGKDSTMKIWPPPTPLKLSDEMKTPGTVFPANMENVQKGKAGIRSQYVHSIINPTTDGSQLKAPNEEISQHNQLSGEPNDNPRQSAVATFLTNMAMVPTDHQEAKFEATLSNWLKPPIDNCKSFQPTGIGLSLAMLLLAGTKRNNHCTSLPSCGADGIPNSTSKYQEDQKVSWHATPFEE